MISDTAFDNPMDTGNLLASADDGRMYLGDRKVVFDLIRNLQGAMVEILGDPDYGEKCMALFKPVIDTLLGRDPKAKAVMGWNSPTGGIVRALAARYAPHPDPDMVVTLAFIRMSKMLYDAADAAEQGKDFQGIISGYTEELVNTLIGIDHITHTEENPNEL